MSGVSQIARYVFDGVYDASCYTIQSYQGCIFTE